MNMRLSKEQWIRTGFLLLCCAVMVVSMAVLLNRKEAWFIDEYYSYACANHEGGRGITFEDGKAYTPEEIQQLARDTYSVPEDGRFRYDVVWKNLAGNVHPPVFYALLHTVCSLTPGQYSPWQAGIVNLFFGLAGLFFFHKLARGLVRSEWLAGFLTLAWTCTLGLYGNLTLLRDYAAAACGVTVSAWTCFRFLRGRREIRDLVLMAAASAFAVLCHYYCLIWLFLLCGMLCLILAIRKEWKAVLRIVAAEGCAAVAAAAVFPSMVRRIFFSSRSAEAAGNLASTDLGAYGDRLAYFFQALQKQFFGNLLWIPGLLLVLFIAAGLVFKRKGILQQEESGTASAAEICLLALPSLAYFLVTAKIAAYLTSRYMYPVTPVLYLSAAALLFYCCRRLPKRRLFAALAVAVLLVAGGLSWTTGSINWLYIGRDSKIRKKLEPCRGMDAVVIWKNRNFMSVALPQYEYFRTVTFYNVGPEDVPEDIPALAEGREAVLLLGMNGEEAYLERLAQLRPEYTAEKLGALDGQGKFCDYLFVPR